jgi:hypothetical protein
MQTVIKLVAGLVAGGVGYAAIRSFTVEPPAAPLTLKEQMIAGVKLDRDKAKRIADPEWISFNAGWELVNKTSQIPWMLGYVGASLVGYEDLKNNTILQTLPDNHYTFTDPRTKGRVFVTKYEKEFAIVYEASDVSDGTLHRC